MNCQITSTQDHSRRVILCLVWFAGLLCGCLLFRCLPAEPLPLMCLVPQNRVSIVGCLWVLILPSLLTAVATQYSLNALAYILVFIKTFFYSFAFSWLGFSYGDGSWLVRFLVLFSDTVFLPVLFLFVFLNLPGREAQFNRSVLYLFVFIMLTGFIDYCFISPFTVRLFIQ